MVFQVFSVAHIDPGSKFLRAYFLYIFFLDIGAVTQEPPDRVGVEISHPSATSGPDGKSQGRPGAFTAVMCSQGEEDAE